MTHFTLYHNPKCSKSRQALALLEATGHPITIIEYLKTPPDSSALRRLFEQLHDPTHDAIRAHEPAYKTLGLSPQSRHDELIEALCQYPELLQRPIVILNDQAAFVARPPERLQEFLAL